MDGHEVRRRFLDFFAARGHIVRPSASLIPVDPTLLLTVAGMVPFKPYLLGEELPPYRRAVSAQKCVRTADIDIVGTTARHMTFFEMLGNFSFGDYFKADAIGWAYELVTEGFGVDPDLLWFTVHETDDEAAAIWIDKVGVPVARLQRGGKDNFWQMGVAGPAGPCSEIFVDRGAKHGDPGGPIGGGEDRYVEIWNLVFMQYVQDEPYHVVGDLPAKNIDTGMGLERAAAAFQGVDTVFEIDLVRPILSEASAVLGVRYGDHPGRDVALRLLADHGRAMTFLVGDGVVPSNEGRGYILRRLVRRAVRHAWSIAGEGHLTPRLVKAVVEQMSDPYPELAAKQDLITEILDREEFRFRRTLESGHQLLDGELDRLAEGEQLAGSVAFKLHDTFGFPVELTTEIVSERGMAVDRAGFNTEMEAQRLRARQAWKGGTEAEASEVYRRLVDEIGSTHFVGYQLERGEARLLALLVDGVPAERAEAGQMVEAFLDVTPFYGESGGQVGDQGFLDSATGHLEVEDTKHALPGFHSHRGKVTAGWVVVGQEVEAMIDAPRRERTAKSHTGTHLLHWALRDVLGSHAHQAGSLVEPGRLRFDFSHFKAVASEELGEAERLANQRIIENDSVQTVETSREEAERLGALAFFGDKYGERVRVVQIGGYSVELCGGTHVPSSGQVGPLIVLGESSIGSNLRRVEALTGEAGFDHLVGLRSRLNEAGRLLKVTPGDVSSRIRTLLDRVESLEESLAMVASKERQILAGQAVESAESIGSARLAVMRSDGLTPDQVRALAVSVRQELGRGVAVVGSVAQGKAALVAAVTKNLTSAGVSAAVIVAEAARQLGGGASRDAELAQAGGPKADQLDTALGLAKDAAARLLAGS